MIPVTSKPPIDLVKIEGVREHLKLRRRDMAELFGVSRMTYYRWITGRSVRVSHQTIVRYRLRKLVDIVRNGWPDAATMQKSSDDRFKELLHLMG